MCLKVASSTRRPAEETIIALLKIQGQGLHAFQSYMWGHTPDSEFTMLVFAGQNAAPDSLKVKYKYVTGKDDPNLEGTWGVNVTSLRYGDVEVLEGNENGKVFIVKPSHGETTVKVGSR